MRDGDDDYGGGAVRFTLTIDMDNAAFEDGPTLEVARILAALAGRLGYDGNEWLDDEGSVRDTNGNTVGGWTINDGADV